MSKHVKTETTRCGCCQRAIQIGKENQVTRVCRCDGRGRCFLCGRCEEHCCRSGWTRPEFPGKRGRR